MRVPLLVVAAAALATGVAAADEPAAAQISLAAEGGYFEEAFALDGAGGRLAVVRADAGGAHHVELRDLDHGGALLGGFPVGASATRVVLAPGGIYVVGGAPGGDRSEAVLYDRAGKRLRRLGPATDFAFTERAGKVTVAAFATRPRPEGSTWEVSFYGAGGDRPIVRRTLALDAAGFIPALRLTPLYFRGGYTELVGRRRGGYDRAQDRFLNDTVAVYDVTRGAVTRDALPRDLVAWTRLARERAKHPNQDTFVYASEDRRHLFAVRADDEVVELGLPLARYDVASLQQQAGPDGRVTFSLTVDPLNPAALARRRRDSELIDFYRFDPASAAPAQPARLLRVARDGRDFLWRASATRIAVLRKHRSFGRGGPRIDVYQWK